MDGYIRVSRRMGRKGPAYISIPVQQEAIRRWADYRGIEIVKWHIDEDESGGTQNRPGLRDAMRRIEAKETEGLACWRLNRFARNVAGAITDVERIHAAGAHLALVEEQIDPTGPFGQFLLTVLLAVGTLERDNAVEGFKTAKRRAVARGAYVSRTPWGYQRITEGERAGCLEPDPVTGPMVAEAFRLAAVGGIHGAMRYLEGSWPHRAWTLPKVRRLLAMRVYLGETRNGEDFQADTHPPLTTRAEWEAAQTTPLPRQSKATFPLTGFPTCGTCGCQMIGARGGAEGARMYRCSDGSQKHRAKRVCSAPVVINAENLEGYVQEKALEALRALEITVGDASEAQLAKLERALMEAEQELEDFAADTKMRRVLGDKYHSHLDTRADEVERARTAYRNFASTASTRDTLTAEDLLDMSDPELFQAGVRSLFETVVVIRKRGRIPVADRTTLIPVGSDDTAGEAAA